MVWTAPAAVWFACLFLPSYSIIIKGKLRRKGRKGKEEKAKRGERDGGRERERKGKKRKRNRKGELTRMEYRN